MKTPTRIAVVAAAALGFFGLLASPALAHVTVNPSEASRGGFAKLTFRVPNEKQDAGTTKVEIAFPEDQPIAFVSVQPRPGWTFQVEKGKPAAPIEAEGEEVEEVVTKITWEGGPINAGEFDEFSISAGPLPDADQMVFKALQTYSDGEVVRWIDEPNADGSEPDKPAPTLKLTAATESGHGGDHDEPTTTVTTEATHGPDEEKASVSAEPIASTKSDETGLAVAGIIIGALGLLVGAGAWLKARG